MPRNPRFPQLVQAERLPCETLTARELEVLALMTAGDSNSAIAVELSRSEETIKHHVRNIFDKLGCSNRTQAAMWYLKSKEAQLAAEIATLEQQLCVSRQETEQWRKMANALADKAA